MGKSPQDVLRQIKDESIELIDLKFTDIHGKWQHLTVTSDMIEEDSFKEGLAFLLLVKQLFPFFETNLLFLKSYKLEFFILYHPILFIFQE